MLRLLRVSKIRVLQLFLLPLLFSSGALFAQSVLVPRSKPNTEWPPLLDLKFPEYYYKKCLEEHGNSLFKDRDEETRRSLVENICGCYRDATLEVGFKKLGPRSTETRVAYWMGMKERSKKEVKNFVITKCRIENDKFIKDVLGRKYFTEVELFKHRVDACQSYYKKAYADRVEKNPSIAQEIFEQFCMCEVETSISYLKLKHPHHTRKLALVDLGLPAETQDIPSFAKIRDGCWNETAKKTKKSE